MTTPMFSCSLVKTEPGELLRAGHEHVWMHASSGRALAASQEEKHIMVEGQGCIVKDINGKEYLDGLAGLGVVNVGHGRKEIGEAMAFQARTLAYASPIQTTNVPAIRLATLLSQMTPGDLDSVFLCSGGSEAVESALKIAWQYQYLAGFPKRFKIIGRWGSYHGATYGALSVSGTLESTVPFQRVMMPGALHVAPPYCYRCDYRQTYPSCEVYCAKAIEQLIEYEGPQTVAAVIVEPVSVSNGVVIPPPEYLPRVRQICDRYGVVLIVDEVVTGLGRTGRPFASEHWGLVGDIMTVANGLSSGYAPIAATICRPHIVDAFTSETGKRLAHLFTFGGQAVACAAALANIAIVERERLVEQAAAMGAYLLEQLCDFPQRHATVGEVRGLGLLTAVELVKDRTTKEKFPLEGAEVRTLQALLLDRGLLTHVTHIIELSPPLCITRDEIDRMVEILDDSLTAFERQYGYC